MTDLKLVFFQAQTQAFGQAAAATAAASAPPAGGQQLPYPLHPSAPGMPESVYPGLSTYMGLEFDEQTIRENMPEYLGGGALMTLPNVSLDTNFVLYFSNFLKWCGF